MQELDFFEGDSSETVKCFASSSSKVAPTGSVNMCGVKLKRNSGRPCALSQNRNIFYAKPFSTSPPSSLEEVADEEDVFEIEGFE